MGERTDRVEEEAGPEKLVQQVDIIREHLSEVVAELDYRRHELMDWRGQVKKHAGLLAAVAGTLGLVASVGVTLAVLERQREPKKKRVREARVPQETLLHRVLLAGAGALAGVLVKTLAQRVIDAGESPAQ